MTLRSILIHPDPRLRKACDLVKEFDEGLAVLARDMLTTMYDAPGIGLAAPQIGVTVRVLVMDCADKDEEEPKPMVLVNPAISWASEETGVYEEGCLSLPDMYAEVTRPKSVIVRYQDELGHAHERDFDGLWATCVQHEIDHLNGKLFIDYLSAVKRQLITNKMKKLKKERARAM